MPPRVFFEKRLQAAENKGRECEKERKERSRGGKLLKTGNLPQRHREHRDGEGMDGECRRGDTPVATGSIRNLLRTGEILTLRGADDGRSRSLRKHTRGCGGISEPNGDTVSRTLPEVTASVTICQVRN
jgi:hypothetical protein